MERREDTDVLAETLDVVQAEGGRAGSPLLGIVDDGHVAVTGHSAGASAAYRLAGTDDRIDAFIAYSLGRRRNGERPRSPRSRGW